jgi:hypothetical protein
LKVVPNGFGEKLVLKLMFGALTRAAEQWRGLRFTEFELRQLAALRKRRSSVFEKRSQIVSVTLCQGPYTVVQSMNRFPAEADFTIAQA